MPEAADDAATAAATNAGYAEVSQSARKINCVRGPQPHEQKLINALMLGLHNCS